MMSRTVLVFLFTSFILLISGCGLIKTDRSTEDSNRTEKQQKTTQSDQQQVTPVQPNQVFPEIPFQAVTWTPSDFKPKATGGIFIYTKEAHTGSIDDDFQTYWETHDILYVQLGTKYKGFELEPMGIEKRSSNLARIILRVKATHDAGNPEEDPAFIFMKIPRGAVNGYSFEVVDEQGKQLTLN